MPKSPSKNANNRSVELVRSEIDKGDDMQSRIHYQAQYVALQALAFLDNECEIDYLYCEHQQDVLIKLLNGRFSGVQVKTKESRLGAFKATEQSIVSSIFRFFQQNKEFPEEFERFVIATNQAFQNSKNKHDVKHLIAASKQRTLHSDLRDYHSENFKNKSEGCTQQELQRLLRIVSVEDNIPDFGAMQTAIAEQIAKRGFLNCRYIDIQGAALSLTNKMRDSAILRRNYSPGMAFLPEPERTLEKRLLEEKKITKAMVINLIKGALPNSGLPGATNKATLAEVKPRKLAKSKMEKIVAEFATATDGLVQWQENLIGGNWIEQETYNDIKNKISTNSHSTIFLLGGAGTGKSQILSKLASSYRSEYVAVFGIKSDQLNKNIASLKMLEQSYSLSFNIEETIKSLSLSQPIIVIIDQLDAVSDLLDLHSERLNVLLELVKSISGTNNVHVIMSARAYEASHDSRLKALEVEKISTALPQWGLVEPILEAAGIATKSFTSEQKEYFRNPQYLKVYLSVEKIKNG